MRFLATVLTVSSMLVMTACGSDEGSVTTPTPTPSTPTVSSLTINGSDALRTGFFTDYTATAVLSNGASQPVTPTWSSSNAAVATVDANGRLNGISHGSVDLAAAYQGMNASKNVSVVSNFGGTWNGTYAVRACDQSGVFASARWCQDTMGGVGSVLPVMLTLSQTGSDRTQVSGSLTLGTGIAGNISGNVTGDGRLNLGGSFTVTSSGVTFQFVFGGWETRLISPGQMRGRWAQSQTATGIPGNAYQEVEIVTMTQTSTTAVPTSAPSHYTLTWQEFFSRIR